MVDAVLASSVAQIVGDPRPREKHAGLGLQDRDGGDVEHVEHDHREDQGVSVLLQAVLLVPFLLVFLSSHF